jgi:hypothetical protein
MVNKNQTSKQLKRTPLPKEEAVLTKDEFFRVLNLVTRPDPSKAKPPKKGKKGTSE